MDIAAKIVNEVFNKPLTGTYAWIFLAYILFCIICVIWAIYYISVKRAAAELPKITWLSFMDTVKYTGITLASIVISCSILFVYDFSLDKVVNLIIENAK